MTLRFYIPWSTGTLYGGTYVPVINMQYSTIYIVTRQKVE